jgi:sporulation protein YlmC with PRC-barrel domain
MTAWTGLEVVDSDGRQVGTVESVRHGEGAGDVRWVVVESVAKLGDKLIIPAEEVRQSGDRLTLPYTAARIVDAPRAADVDSPTEEEKSRICRYYGLVYGADQKRPAEGCEEMPDNRPAG